MIHSVMSERLLYFIQHLLTKIKAGMCSTWYHYRSINANSTSYYGPPVYKLKQHITPRRVGKHRYDMATQKSYLRQNWKIKSTFVLFRLSRQYSSGFTSDSFCWCKANGLHRIFGELSSIEYSVQNISTKSCSL